MIADYPLGLVQAFHENKITKDEYIRQFTNWQREQGLDFTVRGTGDFSGAFVTYRGQTGKLVRGGIELNGKKYFSLVHFKRGVDFYHNRLSLEARALLRGIDDKV